MQSPQKRTRSGWSEDETERLFSLAKEAQRTARPLKSVFDETARLTGRRPNSVRNYYYTRIRERGESPNASRAFIPFTSDEATDLLETVLRAQASGESVRACTLRLAGGDDKRMLRYQNKYRAMLKHNPALVKRMIDDLRRCGTPVPDPYCEDCDRPRVGRPRKSVEPRETYARRVFADLNRVPNLDVRAFLSALGTLAMAAVDGTQTTRETDARAEKKAADLSRQLDLTRAQYTRVNERYRLLLTCFQQLIRINQEFLSLNSVVKVSNLSSYIHDLEENVHSCELLMAEGTREYAT